MIYTHLTKLAMTVAYQAHHGQVDHGNMPYIFHPYHLAEQMQDEYTTCAALLHDVVEDTDATLDLLATQFPKEVVDAVALLTHNEGTNYFDYVTAIKENPIARAVKIADLKHNSDRTRLEISESNLDMVQRYEEKYRKALDILIFNIRRRTSHVPCDCCRIHRQSNQRHRYPAFDRRRMRTGCREGIYII